MAAERKPPRRQRRRADGQLDSALNEMRRVAVDLDRRRGPATGDDLRVRVAAAIRREVNSTPQI